MLWCSTGWLSNTRARAEGYKISVWARAESKYLKVRICPTAGDASLGHIVDSKGVPLDPCNISAATPIPSHTTELWSFWRLVGNNQRFMRGFADISALLHAGNSANSHFNWTPEISMAFENLKNSLSTAPVCVFPYFALPLAVDTYASSRSIGAVLSQKCDSKFKPMQFASWTMKDAKHNCYSTY